MKLNRRQLRGLIYEVVGLKEASSSLSDEDLNMFIEAVYGVKMADEQDRIAYNLKRVKDETKNGILEIVKMIKAMGGAANFTDRDRNHRLVSATLDAIESEIPALERLRQQ